MSRPLISMPRSLQRGHVFEIRTLISHRMETGFRAGANGELIPRDIIQRFTCTYNGTEVFSVDLSPAIAANPFIAFFSTATDSGNIVLRWTGDNGFAVEETVPITVTP